jgi:putative transposase
VWTYDFVHERTQDGRALRVMTVLDEYSRECLAVEVGRRLNSRNVIATFARLFHEHGVSEHIRSDNGSEMTAKEVRKFLGMLHVDTLYIEPASPWENGYIESFNGKPRDELLNGEISYTVLEAKVLVEQWRRHYNQVRPHSSPGLPAASPGGRQVAPIGASRLTMDVVQSLGAGQSQLWFAAPVSRWLPEVPVAGWP